MASVRYDAQQGAWIIDYYYRAPDGKLTRRREKIDAHSAEEAAVALEVWRRGRGEDAAAQDAADGGRRIARDPTIADLARWYVEELQVARGDVDRTRDENRRRLKMFADWLTPHGVTRYSQLAACPHLLDGFASYLRTQAPSRNGRIGLAQNTVRLHMIVIKAVLTAAHKRKIVADLPWVDWPIPRALPPATDETITPEEFRGIIDHLTEINHRMRNAILYLAYIGCRPSDVCALTWEQVDLDRRVVRFVQRKTKQPLTVPLSEPVRAALLEEQMLHRPGPFVFRACRGGPLTEAAISGILVYYAHKLFGRAIRPRAFRQFVTTDIVDAGGDLETVKLLTGHKSRSAEAYLKRKMDRARDAADAFAARRKADRQ
jgi:integrase